MTREDILLKQYEVYSERKLHFGKLFWQTPTFFIAICVFFASIVKDVGEPFVWWFSLLTSILLGLISFIGFRLMKNEEQYEELLLEIEKDLYEVVEGQKYHAHLSEKIGSRFATVLLLFVFSLVLFVVGIGKIFEFI